MKQNKYLNIKWLRISYELYKMLKGIIQSISPVLTDLFNLSISTGKIPQKCKISSVLPIPKTPTNSTDPYKYRPISLLSVVSKLLEKHIYALTSY